MINDVEMRIRNLRTKPELTYPDRQISESVGVNFRHYYPLLILSNVAMGG